MRLFSLIMLIANLLTAGAAAVVCPSPMATHFDGKGIPNGWLPASQHAIYMTLFCIGLILFFEVIIKLCQIFPISLVSIPNKSYWARQENRGKMHDLIASSVRCLGGLTLAFFFLVNLLVIKANLSRPIVLPPIPFYIGMGVYVVALIAWAIKLMVDFRIPQTDDREVDSSAG